MVFSSNKVKTKNFSKILHHAMTVLKIHVSLAYRSSTINSGGKNFKTYNLCKYICIVCTFLVFRVYDVHMELI